MTHIEEVGSYGVMVSTLDFESSDPSSNLGRTFPFFLLKILYIITRWLRGATVARLTPDQKAACSNHVGVRNILYFKEGCKVERILCGLIQIEIKGFFLLLNYVEKYILFISENIRIVPEV